MGENDVAAGFKVVVETNSFAWGFSVDSRAGVDVVLSLISTRDILF